jgi:hypothetical protein
MLVYALGGTLLAFFGVRFILKPVLARRTTPQSDLARIKVAFEGVVGASGINKKIAKIVHSGATVATRYQDAERVYDVTLVRPDGGVQEAKVTVQTVLFGQGRMKFENRYL